MATGLSALAAITVLRHAGAARVVLAVPVALPETIRQLRAVADDVACLLTPTWFRAVSERYEDFGQVGDAEVARLLAHVGPTGAAPAAADTRSFEREVVVEADARRGGSSGASPNSPPTRPGMAAARR